DLLVDLAAAVDAIALEDSVAGACPAPLQHRRSLCDVPDCEAAGPERRIEPRPLPQARRAYGQSAVSRHRTHLEHVLAARLDRDLDRAAERLADDAVVAVHAVASAPGLRPGQLSDRLA